MLYCALYSKFTVLLYGITAHSGEGSPCEYISSSSIPLTPTPSPASPTFEPAIEIEQQTDSNHDTALSVAAAGGHDDLVNLLLSRKANLEHRDKKGKSERNMFA